MLQGKVLVAQGGGGEPVVAKLAKDLERDAYGNVQLSGIAAAGKAETGVHA